MGKINLNVEREFSDSITATFNFVKQEFVPLIKALAVIVLPVILVDFFVKGFFMQSLLELEESRDSWSVLRNAMWTGVSSGIIYTWMGIMVVSYLKVYYDKYRQGDENRITPKEVWQVMLARLGSSLFASFAFGLIFVIGVLFFIVPGIYFSIAFVFVIYCLIIQNKPVDSAFGASRELVRGKWWNMFLYLIVLQLIIGVMAWIFNIPYFFLTIKAVITENPGNLYEMTLCYYLSNLGQYLSQTLLLVGVGIRFFSYLEQKEHTVLLDKIGQLGQDTPEQEREDGEIR